MVMLIYKGFYRQNILQVVELIFIRASAGVLCHEISIFVIKDNLFMTDTLH